MGSNNNTKEKTKPFLRWAGGKNWFTKHIENYLPKSFENYFEPFLGGGSIFFYLKSKGLIKNTAFLSDSNKDLINAYQVIKSHPNDLIKLLSTHKDSEIEYYKIRSKLFDNSIENAAKFLYLNKTSFNGIYRVNRDGKYNVPYGKRDLQTLYNYEHILKVSELLDKTNISCSDFKNSCKKAKENDFVFLDPPYTVAHENNGFIQYNQSIFSWENQIELSKITDLFSENKVHFLVTNAYHHSIQKLYGFNQIPISRSSTIGGKGAKRAQYKELLITNIK